MPRRAGRRTDYEWANCGDVKTANDMGAVAFVICSLEIALAGTLTRMRGRVGATLNTGGVGEHCILLLGVAIMNTDAVTAGGFPEILSSGTDEASWVWQGSIYLSSGAEAAIVPDRLSWDIGIDTKAMRRMKPSENVVLIGELPAALANDQAGTVDVTGFLHTLFGR